MRISDWSSDVCSSDLLRPVHGALRLGEALRNEALDAARGSRAFLRLLAEQTAQIHPAIGLFGRLREKEGRVDLKLGGLLPLVSAARVMARREERRGERGGQDVAVWGGAVYRKKKK